MGRHQIYAVHTSSRRRSLECPLLTTKLIKAEDKSVAMVENRVIKTYRKNEDKLAGMFGFDTINGYN
jgi:hypothetical protein